MSQAVVDVHRWRDTAAVTLRSAALEATFLPELNMLGTSLRLGGAEFMALSGGVRTYRRGHTTGLPLLAPWANRLGGLAYAVGRTRVELAGLDLHTDSGGLPIHGTLSAREAWHVTELGARAGVARLCARFDYERADLLAAFPFPHRLETRIELGGSSLSVATSLTPLGSRPVPVSFGYHPYLRLPEGRRSAWRLRLPKRHRLELDERGIPTGRRDPAPAEDAPIGGRTLDDLFELTGGRRLTIEDSRHALSVECGAGYRFAQVFAPPGKRFVCLEPMTAPTNALVARACPVVPPGETFTARFRIRLQRRPGAVPSPAAP